MARPAAVMPSSSAAMLDDATRAELMLIAVHEEPLLEGVVPVQVGWASSKNQAREMLGRTRDSLAPQARTVVESNGLAWRGLLAVDRREHRDLLVVGSSRHAGDGHARLGRNAGELHSHVECPLAIVPRGLRAQSGALLAKNCRGWMSLYAHPAAPNTVVFPPPFGPIKAVTRKSKRTS